ncbi:MAG: hypothetical protein M4579_006837 [Chaenotheca gracillima]|nr:MAG: hypothetical protein M4579_006837 [Chaenotheca gracillima]
MASTSKYLSKLAKSRVLILGGTSGIGFAVAEASLEYGATVVVSSSNPQRISRAVERLQTTYPEHASRISGFACDLSQADSIESNLEKLFQFATSASGLLDHIVFTAGDPLKIPALSEVTVENLNQLGNVRFMGSMMVGKLAPKYLNPRPTSSITLTGGVNSEKPLPGWAAIASYGAGLEGMMRGFAVDLKPVRVNLVSPGLVQTELLDSIPEAHRGPMLEKGAKATTVGVVGQPEDLAEAYLYTMKDHFVTGSVIHSNGGALLV